MGGASADSAGIIKGLGYMWDLDSGRLKSIAEEMGSDVPFCLNGGCAVAGGRGEILEPVEPLSGKVILALPNLHIDTKSAYQWLGREAGGPPPNSHDERLHILRNGSIKNPNILGNDFEEQVFKRYPFLLSIKKSAYENGAILSNLSGSGSAIFALPENESSAKAIKQAWAKMARVEEVSFEKSGVLLADD